MPDPRRPPAIRIRPRRCGSCPTRVRSPPTCRGRSSTATPTSSCIPSRTCRSRCRPARASPARCRVPMRAMCLLTRKTAVDGAAGRAADSVVVAASRLVAAARRCRALLPWPVDVRRSRAGARQHRNAAAQADRRRRARAGDGEGRARSAAGIRRAVRARSRRRPRLSRSLPVDGACRCANFHGRRRRAPLRSRSPTSAPISTACSSRSSASRPRARWTTSDSVLGEHGGGCHQALGAAMIEQAVRPRGQHPRRATRRRVELGTAGGASGVSACHRRTRVARARAGRCGGAARR